MKEVKNLAHSVHARLLQKARATGRPFQELLEYFGMERFLYRLSRSVHADRFILKGALMFRVWDAPMTRPTRDIDLMGYVENTLENLQEIVRDLCQLEVEPDGLRFDPSSVEATRIKEDADYQGVRLNFWAYLGKARFPMQIDVGFGDRVEPVPARVEYPTILEFPRPVIKGYAKETSIAEKYEAMVSLGTLNSRMKDFYDIWYLANRFEFEGPTLSRAIQATFFRRGIEVDPAPVAWTPTFTADPTAMSRWTAFLRRSRLEGAPSELGELVPLLVQFLAPVARAIRAEDQHDATWVAGGPWR